MPSESGASRAGAPAPCTSWLALDAADEVDHGSQRGIGEHLLSSREYGSPQMLPPPVPVSSQEVLEDDMQTRISQSIEELSRVRRSGPRKAHRVHRTLPAVPKRTDEDEHAALRMQSRPGAQMPGIGETQPLTLDESMPTVTLHQEVVHGSSPKERHRGHRRRHKHSSSGWSESLMREVERLRRKNSYLESRLSDADTGRRALERDLEQARRHCLEADSAAGPGGPAAAAQEENAFLRKQLSAYAVEIDVLREEKSRLSASLQEAQESVQQLTVEREELYSTSGKMLKQLSAERADLEESGNSSRYAAELATAQAAEHGVRVRELLDVVQPLRDALAELQQGYVAQTREYSDFVAAVKERQQSAAEIILAAKHGLGENELETGKLTRHFAEVDEHHARSLKYMRQTLAEHGLSGQLLDLENKEFPSPRAKSHLRAQKAAKSLVLSAFEKALKRNVAKEIHRAQEGMLLDKINEGDSNRESRLVTLSETEMLLKWAKPQRDSKTTLSQLNPMRLLPHRHESHLDLYEVIRIDYGCMTRACVLHSSALPWRCVSLYTTRRSYEFICPDDDTTRAFVLSISRLCEWAGGAVRTRHNFECLKGWCKIEEFCFRTRKTLCRALLEATYAAQAEIGAGSSPTGTVRAARAVADAERRGILPVVSESSRTRIHAES